MACLKVTINGVVNEYCTVEGNADCFTYVDTQYEPCCETKEECPLPLKDWPSKVCVEKPEAMKDGKPVTTDASALAAILKETPPNNGQPDVCLDYVMRQWGKAYVNLEKGEATLLYTDTEKRICAHRTAAGAHVDCTIERFNTLTGCGGLLAGTARLSTIFYKKICKENL